MSQGTPYTPNISSAQVARIANCFGSLVIAAKQAATHERSKPTHLSYGYYISIVETADWAIRLQMALANAKYKGTVTYIDLWTGQDGQHRHAECGPYSVYDTDRIV